MVQEAEARSQARDAAEGDVGSRVLERLVAQIGGRAQAQAVFGDRVEHAGVVVIPVARVRWGVGGGGGGGEGVDGAGSGSGGGGGVTADPIGYIEITAAGAEFRPIPRSFGGPLGVLAAAAAAAIVIRAIRRLVRG